jgi:hypothetical protein
MNSDEQHLITGLECIPEGLEPMPAAPKSAFDRLTLGALGWGRQQLAFHVSPPSASSGPHGIPGSHSADIR